MVLWLVALTASSGLRAESERVTIGGNPGTTPDRLLTGFLGSNGLYFKGSLPLSEFLRQGDVNSGALGLNLRELNDRLDRFDHRLDDVNERLDSLNEKLNEITALNAALDFQRPAPGKNYRVFTGFGQFQDKVAVGIGVTGTFRTDFDYGVGVSFSANQVLTKGSVGWSF